MIATKGKRRDIREARQAPFEDFDLLGRRSFLRAKGPGCPIGTEQGISNIAGRDEPREREFVRRNDSRQIEQIGNRSDQLAIVIREKAKAKATSEAEPAVIRGAAAEPEDDLARAAGGGGEQHFAHAEGRGF